MGVSRKIAMLIEVVVLALLAVLNAFATAAALRSPNSSRKQKVAQICLAWLVPILGSLLVLGVARDREPRTSGTYPEDQSYGWNGSSGTGGSASDNDSGTFGADSAGGGDGSGH